MAATAVPLLTPNLVVFKSPTSHATSPAWRSVGLGVAPELAGSRRAALVVQRPYRSRCIRCLSHRWTSCHRSPLRVCPQGTPPAVPMPLGRGCGTGEGMDSRSSRSGSSGTQGLLDSMGVLHNYTGPPDPTTLPAASCACHGSSAPALWLLS
ncbi:hypothetical protein FB451DRAFT_1223649 [Mycena latifolia]|nr:hypothetical protein FB451DRAFT_1267039 [Mycena latifolia]KAJ7489060.1 hypothetical protein FB451DRAFT_1223649 [Mycena latifolia]